MSLSLKWYVKRITTKFEFKIARSAESYYDVVILELSDGQYTGYGEAAPSKRYEKGPAAILDLLVANEKQILALSLKDHDDRQAALERLFPESYSLQSALDIAFWDLFGRQSGQALWKIFGAQKNMVASSYTIGISDLDIIPTKLKEAAPYDLLKIKLGTDYDHEIMRAIRSQTDKVLRVDVNEGWKTLDDAKRGAEWLAGENVEFLEQPMPAHQLDDIAKLRDFSPLPLVADENSVRPEDIPGLVGAYDGINIKLMKCGGLTNARKMVELAHHHNFDIMLGCMVETSIGISAMSQLGSFARWLDLDGNVLLAHDPYIGVGNEAGKIVLSDKPGLGIEPRN
ncbi:MAG: dipeptide epimerase [Candidatus Marinimicrobia bacterium]|nr:dipeptide epimerase [Candidatus Neomarinimicrobiota bacterium]